MRIVIVRLRLGGEIHRIQVIRTIMDVDGGVGHKRTIGSSQEHRSSGNHREHPQPLPPLNPHKSHDNHVEDVFGTRAEFEGEFGRTEETRSVELGDNSLSTVNPFKFGGVESDETKVPPVADTVHFERPVES